MRCCLRRFQRAFFRASFGPRSLNTQGIRSTRSEWSELDRRTTPKQRNGTAGGPRRARPFSHRALAPRGADPLAHPVDRSFNSAVVVVLAALIWNGAKVLGSAWDDVRQVRESDKILALLETETSRLQNLIHRYINQPSPELFAEILLLREAVLGTLTTRATTDPMLSGSVAVARTRHQPLPRRFWRIARRAGDHHQDL